MCDDERVLKFIILVRFDEQGSKTAALEMACAIGLVAMFARGGPADSRVCGSLQQFKLRFEPLREEHVAVMWKRSLRGCYDVK
jgi:hypothetical protein